MNERRLRFHRALDNAVLALVSVAFASGIRPDWFWWPISQTWFWWASFVLCVLIAATSFALWLGDILGIEERQP